LIPFKVQLQTLAVQHLFTITPTPDVFFFGGKLSAQKVRRPDSYIDDLGIAESVPGQAEEVAVAGRKVAGFVSTGWEKSQVAASPCFSCETHLLCRLNHQVFCFNDLNAFKRPFTD